MIILGLDIATTTGWCIHDQGDDEAPFRTGEWDCSPKGKDEPEGVRYHRLALELEHLAVMSMTPPDAVVLEEPFTASKRGAHVLGGLIAAALVVLEAERIPYVFVNASTLKSWARHNGIQPRPTGAGKRPTLKEGMRLEAMHLLGRDLTDNEADAYWLTRYFLEHHAPHEATVRLWEGEVTRNLGES